MKPPHHEKKKIDLLNMAMGSDRETTGGNAADSAPLLERGGVLVEGRKASLEDGYERNSCQQMGNRSKGEMKVVVPRGPTTDPFGFVCEWISMPKYGHQYVVCPANTGRRCCFKGVELSVGPHWGGVLYTISIIAFATLFFTHHIIVGLPVWYLAVTVVSSAVTVAFLLATACTDPGIVRQSADRRPGLRFCKECSIWKPEGADHCDECGVCIQDLDHHCPWMGKCVGRGNMLWFKLFNATWICLLLFVIAAAVLHEGKQDTL